MESQKYINVYSCIDINNNIIRGGEASDIQFAYALAVYHAHLTGDSCDTYASCLSSSELHSHTCTKYMAFCIEH